MKKIDFSVLIAELKKLVQRFPFVVFSVLGLSSIFLAEINDWNKDIEAKVYVFFVYATFLTFSIALATERTLSKLMRNLISLVVLGLLAWYAFSLPDVLIYNLDIQHIILGLILFMTLFVVAFFRKNNDDNFWEFGKKNIVRMVLAYVFSGILMGGLSLAVLSLQELFSIEMSDKVYQNLAVFCLLIFSVFYFLMHVPGVEEKYKLKIDFSKPLKFLSLYILIPVLGLYLIILYIYLIKIIVAWELPNGWVTTLISVLGLIGLLTIIILYPVIKSKENKLINFLGKYFPLMIIPLLILMSIAIFRRIDDYGLTANRLFALRLNIWLYGISIFLYITASRHPKWILISLLAVALVSTWGPLNSFVVTKNILLSSWTENLEKAGLYKNNQVILPDTTYKPVAEVDYNRIVDVYTYLRDNYGENVFHPYFPSKIDKKLSAGIYSLNKFKKDSVLYDFPKWQSRSFRIKYDLNVTEVLSNADMLVIYWNKQKDDITSDPFDHLKVDVAKNIMFVEFKNKSMQIPLNQFVNELISVNKTEGNISDGTFEGIGYKLIIQEVNFTYSTVDFTVKEITDLNALLFIKK